MSNLFLLILIAFAIVLVFKIIKKVFKIILIIVIIGLVGFLIYKNLFREQAIPWKGIFGLTQELNMIEANLQNQKEALLAFSGENKKVAIIVAFRDFKDEEYFPPKEVLEQAGAKVLTCSNKEGVAIGVSGGEAKIDVLLGNLNVSEFDAIVFIGGPGALEHLDNEHSYRVAREAVENDKILSAICISPTILAKAGVLKGKRATVWSAPLNKDPVRTLGENGAIFEDRPVVVDGNVVTGNGPSAAREFGKALVEALQK